MHYIPSKITWRSAAQRNEVNNELVSHLVFMILKGFYYTYREFVIYLCPYIKNVIIARNG